MIEAALFSTTEGCTNNIPMIHNPSVSTKKPIAIKSLHQFIETFDVKNNTSIGGSVQLRQIIIQ